MDANRQEERNERFKRDRLLRNPESKRHLPKLVDISPTNHRRIPVFKNRALETGEKRAFYRGGKPDEGRLLIHAGSQSYTICHAAGARELDRSVEKQQGRIVPVPRQGESRGS